MDSRFRFLPPSQPINADTARRSTPDRTAVAGAGPEEMRKMAPGRIIAACIGDSNLRDDRPRNENMRFIFKSGSDEFQRVLGTVQTSWV